MVAGSGGSGATGDSAGAALTAAAAGSAGVDAALPGSASCPSGRGMGGAFTWTTKPGTWSGLAASCCSRPGKRRRQTLTA
eukprot:9197982-Alexandrium_andersonii.AAC.1